jgi:hypothetical protein
MLSIDTRNYSKKIINKHISLSSCENNYIVLNYDPKYISIDDDWSVTKYRSVIIDPATHHLLCVAPWGAMTKLTHDYDMDENTKLICPENVNMYADTTVFETDDAKYIADEMVEGTMINLFYDERNGKWQIATRSAITGNYWFYRTEYGNTECHQKSFYQMMMEALRYDMDTSLENIALLNDLPTHYCYSFVLQHPENHIVLSVTQPNLYLVGVFEIINRTTTGDVCVYNETEHAWNQEPRVRYINTHSYTALTLFQEWFNVGILHLPKILYADSIAELKEKYCSETSSLDYMGVMITNIFNGYHISIDNPRYQALKELRGNNPNLQYHFLALNKIDKINEFLVAFPIYVHAFHHFRTQYNRFIALIHHLYVSYYIKKDKSPIDKQYFVHVANIHHTFYIPGITSGNKIIVTFDIIKKYFDEMDPSRVLYYINYDATQV